MERNDIRYRSYTGILKRELLPAMGCTEPIAVAYCAAKARAVLGATPDRVLVEASGNIIKNVKSVIVPNTNGGRGIAAAAAIGILGGDETKGLEVISGVSEEAKAELGSYLERTEINVSPAGSDYVLDITVTVWHRDSRARVRVVNEHTNLVLVEKDGLTLEEREILETADSGAPDYGLLNIKDIYDYACTADLQDVSAILERQIELNSAISRAGLSGSFGANIGSVLLETCGGDIRTRAKAGAAAGSDARMNGCELPVVINSGSGNQGITASMPVIEYAGYLGVTRETLHRALLISNLITLHQKTGIGRLSAFCGAVNAGAGAGAGIAYLHGGGLEAIEQTVVNALAIVSGIVCDGAKSSCAAKISVAVDAGILGFEMNRSNQRFCGGDGIVAESTEGTIRNVGILGRQGMRETDSVIIDMMTQ